MELGRLPSPCGHVPLDITGRFDSGVGLLQEHVCEEGLPVVQVTHERHVPDQLGDVHQIR